MRKLMNITMLLLVTILLASCNNKPKDIEYIEMYYLNDLHGSILENDDQMGLARIANLLMNRKTTNPDNVLLLAGGDMLQGSALSNYFYGESVIEMLDLMDFDAFTLGNHEFDWGIEEVTKYFDEDESNGEANFPLLGANVFYEGTDNIVEHIDPYTIIERGQIRIGVIGTMGYGLEYSIATERINGYEFGSPITEIAYYTELLRTTEDCDIVVVVSHDPGGINSDVSDLTGNQRVDAVFNAHSHKAYATDSVGIPTLQAGSNGRYVGYLRFGIDGENVTDITFDILDDYDEPELLSINGSMEALIQEYELLAGDYLTTPLLTTPNYLSRDDLSNWVAEVMRVFTNADFGIHNSGGTRANIDGNTPITLSTLYDVWPFDNTIMTVELPGSVITTFLQSGSGVLVSTSITEIESATMYKVATNSYIFNKTSNPFLYGTNPLDTGFYMRDIVYEELLLQKELYSTFQLSNDILTQPYYE